MRGLRGSRCGKPPAITRAAGAVPPGLDLVERVDDRVEGQQRRGVARLEVAHRLENLRSAQCRPGGAPFSFSIRRMVSRSSRSSAARRADDVCGP